LSLTINRVVGAMERRVGESLNVRSNQFQDLDWPEISETLLREVENVLERQFDRLLGAGGAISRDLDPLLDRLSDYTTDEFLLMDLLGVMMEGQRMVFDRKTHRQGFQVTRRLNYVFLAGQLLQDKPVPEVSEMVLNQLEGAREELQQAWGRFEWSRLVQNNITLSQLDRRIQSRLVNLLGQERFDQISAQHLDALDGEESQAVIDALGWFDQNEATRQLLLSVISDLWVDYLTRVEALRVSIGLEAYAQRDPLVQYKGRASEMFQQLLADIRMGVISRLFTFRPRPQAPQTAASDARGEGAADSGSTSKEAAPELAQAGPGPQTQGSGKNKKKRKRH
jgi:preprotein translocase subunit SecA